MCLDYAVNDCFAVFFDPVCSARTVGDVDGDVMRDAVVGIDGGVLLY